MVLRCSECGGALEIQGASEWGDQAERSRFVERYECVSCGATGTYRVDEHGTPREETTGCVTVDRSAY